MSCSVGIKRGPEVVTISDSDDEQSQTTQPLKKTKQDPSPSPGVPPSSATLKSDPSASPSLSSLPSRSELEAERVARQQARHKDQNAPGPSFTVRPAPTPVNVATINSVQPDSSQAKPSGPGSGKGKGVATFASLGPGGGRHSAQPKDELRFWKGALRRVPNVYRFVGTVSKVMSTAELTKSGHPADPTQIRSLSAT